MKQRMSVAIILASTVMSGCIPFYSGYNESSMYAPGGALADKATGSPVLATATETSINTMFPKGTSKSVVSQRLGAPNSSSTSSNGTSSQVYTYSFTSYQRKSVQAQTVIMQYDKSDLLTKVDFSTSTSTW
jgi:hypothetical protein